MDAREQFAEWSGVPGSAGLLLGWETACLEIDGETAGVAILSGTEIHFALAPEWRKRAITRRRVRDFLSPLLARRGFLTTRAHNPTDEMRRFLYRMGFVTTWAEPDVEHFMLCAVPYQKGP